MSTADDKGVAFVGCDGKTTAATHVAINAGSRIAAVVCKAIETSRRREVLSFNH